jgi:cyclic-di-GMP-binding protein
MDAATCKTWLDHVPLINIGAANSMLQTHLERFAAVECNAETRFATLEVLRPAIVTLQREHGKRFRSKALPLSPQRRANLAATSSLWDALARSYRRCLETMTRRDEAGTRLLAHMCFQAMDAIVHKMVDYHHTYVQVASADYTELHKLFQWAEHAGVLRTRVRDEIAPDRTLQTCVQLYVSAILFESSMPREHRPLGLGIIERWVGKWASKVVVSAAAPEHPIVPPLVVNLQAPGGARQESENGNAESLRYLDMTGITQSLERRIEGLQKGRRPEEVGLGTEISRRDGEALLVALYRQWCGGTIRRVSERHRIDARAHVSTGIRAAHFYVSKRPFEQPPDCAEAAMTALPEPRIKAAADYMLSNGIVAEEWIVGDESLGGIGLVRPRDELNKTRLAHAQLVSVRPRGAPTMLVGTIQWLQEAQDGELHIGVRLIPGLATPVAVRVSKDEKFQPALLVAPVTALSSPTSLLLASGTYASQRVVEMHGRDRQEVQFTGLLEHGADFERIAFHPTGR